MTPRRRLLRLVAIAGVAAALAAAGIALNLLLLGYADPSDAPVGTLTPRATLTQPAVSTARTATRPGEDDDGQERDD